MTTNSTIKEQSASVTNPPHSSSATFDALSTSATTPAPTPASAAIGETSAAATLGFHFPWDEFRIYSLEDVDMCNLPPKDMFPVTAWPLNSVGKIDPTPSIALWHALSMDQWLEEVFRLCPAALRTFTDEGKRVAFSQVLGRLLFGSKDGADSAIARVFISSPLTIRFANRVGVLGTTGRDGLEVTCSLGIQAPA